MAEPDLEGELESFLSSGATVFAGDMASKFLQFFAFVAVTQSLSLPSFGVLSLGLVVFQFGSTISLFGFNNSLQHFLPRLDTEDEKRDLARTVLAITIVISLAVSVAVVLLAKPIAEVFATPGLVPVLFVIAVTLPVAAVFSISISISQAFELIRPRVLIEKLLFPVSRFVFVVVASLTVATPIAMATAYLLGYVTAMGTTLRAIWDKIRTVSTDTADVDRTELVRFSAPLLLVGIVNMATGQIDKTLLGLLSTAESVGVFNVVFTLSQNFLIVFGSLQFLFTPVFSRLHDSDEYGQLFGFYERITKWGFYPTAVLLIFVFVFAEPLLTNFFRPEYVRAATSLRLLALGSAVSAVLGLNSAALLSIGYSRLHLYNAIVALGLNAGLDYLLIPKFGVFGAALGTVVALGTTNIIYSVQLYRYTGIHPISPKLILPAITGLVLTGSSFLLSIGSATLPFRTLVFGGLLAGFVLTVLGTGGIDRKDRKLMVSLGKKLRRRVGV